MSLQTFENGAVWKHACRSTADIDQKSGAPKNFGLRDQIQSAALSIPSNIGEGKERDCDGDLVRFLRIAKGSVAELPTQLSISRRLGVASAMIDRLVAETKEIAAMLRALIKSVPARTATS
ncbi:MAG: four helix bundle protein [Verrucomicrobiota bacterium]